MASPTEYNGAACLAMVGKDCVGIAADTRLGIQSMTIGDDFQKMFKMGDKLFVGLPGLATDVLTLASQLRFKQNMFKLREEREMEPKSFSTMLSNTLYEKRFAPWFVEPVVAGLDGDGKPFISAMDLIGAECFAKDFVVSGTCPDNMYGMCESLFKPDQEPDDLFETMAQCLLSAVDRDAISGWGAVVHIITAKGVTTRRLRGRPD